MVAIEYQCTQKKNWYFLRFNPLMFLFTLLIQLVREAFYAEKNVDTKEHQTDLVTETDQESERLIKGHFKEKFPTHRYFVKDFNAIYNI